MKISYIREMKRSYLTIETEDEEQRESHIPSVHWNSRTTDRCMTGL